MGESTDLAPLDGGMELVPITTKQELAAMLAGLSEVREPTADELAATRFAIIAEMLEAASEEELWTELPTWSSKDNIGRTFRILSVRAYRSKFENEAGGKGGFMSSRAIDVLGTARPTEELERPPAAGELGIFNTSAMRLCGRIGWYFINDALPVTLKVISIGDSPRGYPILDAELVDEPTVTPAPAPAADDTAELEAAAG